MLGDLEFGFAQLLTGLGDMLQKVHGRDSVMIGKAGM